MEPGLTSVTMSQWVVIPERMVSYVAPLPALLLQTRSPTSGAASLIRKALNGFELLASRLFLAATM